MFFSGSSSTFRYFGDFCEMSFFLLKIVQNNFYLDSKNRVSPRFFFAKYNFLRRKIIKKYFLSSGPLTATFWARKVDFLDFFGLFSVFFSKCPPNSKIKNVDLNFHFLHKCNFARRKTIKKEFSTSDRQIITFRHF